MEWKIDNTNAYRNKNAKRAAHILRDMVLLGDWKEIDDTDATKIKPELAPETLNGLIIKGYEMKFGKTNENGEQYDQTAFDEFIQRYFVDGKMNMPTDVNHEGFHNWHAYCGKVLYIEVNTVGFYFVVYVPRTYPEYDQLKWALQNGIIQGFSKEGFVGYNDYDLVWNEDGSFSHEQIHKMSIVSVSLVCTPANGIPFEKMRETKDALVFENKLTKEKPQAKSFADMFNK